MDYVKFARAKGLTPARVIFVHVLKNILIPVVTVVGLELGSTIAFAVVTESVFAWPGMGKLIIDSDQRAGPAGDRRIPDDDRAAVRRRSTWWWTCSTRCWIRACGWRRRGERDGSPLAEAATPLAASRRGAVARRAIMSTPLPPLRAREPLPPLRREFAASRSRSRPGRLRPDRPRRDLRRADRAAEPLRPRAARHHGRPPAARLRIGCRLHLHPRHRRPGPRHVVRHPLRPAHLARRRRRLGAHRLRRSAPRSACSPPMSAAAPMPPSCAWSTCSCPSRPSWSR